MKISIKTSGGIGNIQLQGQIDTNELESTLAEKALTLLSAKNLSSIASKERTQIPDSIQYEIGLYQKSGVQQFIIDDTAAPTEVVDTIQELVQNIVKRKKRMS